MEPRAPATRHVTLLATLLLLLSLAHAHVYDHDYKSPRRALRWSSASASTACDPTYEQWNATTKSCECKSGFHGWGCQMCASDESCQSALGGGYSCDQGLAYNAHTEHKTYDCVLDASLQALFSDGAMAVQCNRTSQNCSAAVYKAHDGVKGEHVIDCVLTTCVFKNDSSGDGDCGRIDCKCGKQCSSMTKAIVETALSGKPAKISISNHTTLAIDIEGSPIPLAAQCSASACELSGGSSSGSEAGGDDSKWPTGLVIAIATCAIAAASLLCGVCCCSCFVTTHIKSGSVDIDQELTALASKSGQVLEFKKINCYAQQKQAAKRGGGNSSSSEKSSRKRILHDISGSVNRGCVLGLLGPSGSGKTSLLNALAAVENGRTMISGELNVDGKSIPRDYRKIAAYVQQDDSLYATLTVRECILYSAQLRLPSSASENVKHAMVDRVIDELNLGHIMNSRIGSSGASRGISGGERRRVSIGMELVTAPQILFLDEPTSGLDSSSANSVVQLVKELAGHGRIVVLSIHQPSAKSFLLLDQIMLLAKGKMLYHGAPAEARAYFQELGFICPQVNVAYVKL